jgi:hypothetical protein
LKLFDKKTVPELLDIIDKIVDSSDGEIIHAVHLVALLSKIGKPEVLIYFEFLLSLFNSYCSLSFNVLWKRNCQIETFLFSYCLGDDMKPLIGTRTHIKVLIDALNKHYNNPDMRIELGTVFINLVGKGTSSFNPFKYGQIFSF